MKNFRSLVSREFPFTKELTQLANLLFKNQSRNCFGLFIKKHKSHLQRSSVAASAPKNSDFLLFQELLEEYVGKIGDFVSLLYGNFFYFRFRKQEKNIEFLLKNKNQIYIKGVYFQISVVFICLETQKSFILKNKSKQTEKSTEKFTNESKFVDTELKSLLFNSTWEIENQENNLFMLENYNSKSKVF